MERRDFLKVGAAGLAAVTTPVLAEDVSHHWLHAPSHEVTLRGMDPSPRPGGKQPMLAPVADYPYKIRSAYLNCAAGGLIAKPVSDRIQAQFADRASGASYAGPHVSNRANDPHEAAARLYGTQAANIARVSCVSEAMSQVAWWLRPARGKNVVTIDIEIPATTLPWLRVARETGVEVRMARVWDDPAALSFEKVAALVDKNTAAICVSHVQYTTGYRLDLKALADLAHAHGALLIVDAYQTAGIVPLDVHASDVDVLVAGGAKWIGAGEGGASCYMRPELLERFQPILVGTFTADPAPPYDEVESRVLHFAPGARRWEYASEGGGAFAYATAVNYLMDAGIDRVEAHSQRLGATLAEGLRKLGATLITPEDPAKRAGITTVQFKGRNAVGLVKAMQANDVYASPRHGMIRFACHLFNDEEGIDRALFAVQKAV